MDLDPLIPSTAVAPADFALDKTEAQVCGLQRGAEMWKVLRGSSVDRRRLGDAQGLGKGWSRACAQESADVIYVTREICAISRAGI